MAAEHFCLRWNNHQSTLISVFDNLLEREALVDCTLAADGRYLKAHKVVLSACSPYLGMLLTQHYDKHPIIILKDVKFDELKAMLDYMYRGEVNISQEQLSAFLKAAESLQIKGLTDSGAEELNTLQSNRPPSSNSTTSATNEDPQSPRAAADGGSPISRKRKSDKDDVLEGEISPKLSASDSSAPDGQRSASDSSISTAKNVNLTRVKTEPFVDGSEVMSTGSVDESGESAVFSRPGPSNESGSSVKGPSWGPPMDNSWDGVQVSPGQDVLEYAMRVGPVIKGFKSLAKTTKKKRKRANNCPSKLPGVFSCPRCPKVYSYKNNLLRHLNVECGKQANLHCPFCSYKSKHKCDLTRHMKKRHHNLYDPSDIEMICKEAAMDQVEDMICKEEVVDEEEV